VTMRGGGGEGEEGGRGGGGRFHPVYYMIWAVFHLYESGLQCRLHAVIVEHGNALLIPCLKLALMLTN
jgi:hypothetical protein